MALSKPILPLGDRASQHSILDVMETLYTRAAVPGMAGYTHIHAYTPENDRTITLTDYPEHPAPSHYLYSHRLGVLSPDLPLTHSGPCYTFEVQQHFCFNGVAAGGAPKSAARANTCCLMTCMPAQPNGAGDNPQPQRTTKFASPDPSFVLSSHLPKMRSR